MKLLTIEIEDKFSRGLEKITEGVEMTLHDEAYLRGWAPGYKLNPNPNAQTLDNREVVYTFVVEGSYENNNDLVAGDTIVSSQGLSEQTEKVLSTLTPREEKVLRMRFGIGEKTDHTLEEVVMGEKMNLANRFKALAKERQFEQAAEARNSVEYIEIIENLAGAAEYGNDEYYGNTLMSLGVKLALELDGFHVYRDPNGLYFRVCFGLGGSDD
jgi:hypothetical protein